MHVHSSLFNVPRLNTVVSLLSSLLYYKYSEKWKSFFWILTPSGSFPRIISYVVFCYFSVNKKLELCLYYWITIYFTVFPTKILSWHSHKISISLCFGWPLSSVWIWPSHYIIFNNPMVCLATNVRQWPSWLFKHRALL